MSKVFVVLPIVVIFLDLNSYTCLLRWINPSWIVGLVHQHSAYCNASLMHICLSWEIVTVNNCLNSFLSAKITLMALCISFSLSTLELLCWYCPHTWYKMQNVLKYKPLDFVVNLFSDGKLYPFNVHKLQISWFHSALPAVPCVRWKISPFDYFIQCLFTLLLLLKDSHLVTFTFKFS